MFVRFPIILARPTSLRGSLSPGPWPQVIRRMPGGGKQNSGLSCFCCVSGATAMEKYPAGPAGRCALCVCPCLCCVLILVSCCLSVCAALPIMQTPQLLRYLLALAPVNLVVQRVLPLAQCCIPCLCCPPVSILLSLSSHVCPPVTVLPYLSSVTILLPLSCLCPPIPVLSSPSSNPQAPSPVFVPPPVSEPAGWLCLG